MTRLTLPTPLYNVINQSATRNYPNEACGIIVGIPQHRCKPGCIAPTPAYGIAAYPIPNTHPDPLHHYTMDVDAQLAAYRESDRLQLDPICIWHTHTAPSTTTDLSDIDLLNIHDTNLLQLVLTVEDATVKQHQLWQIDQHHNPTPAHLEII